MANLKQIQIDSDWGKEAPNLNANFNAINTELAGIKNNIAIKLPLFGSTTEAENSIPLPYVGQMVLIGTSLPAPVYRWDGSSWANTGMTGGNAEVALTDYLGYEDLGMANEILI